MPDERTPERMIIKDDPSNRVKIRNTYQKPTENKKQGQTTEKKKTPFI